MQTLIFRFILVINFLSFITTGLSCNFLSRFIKKLTCNSSICCWSKLLKWSRSYGRHWSLHKSTVTFRTSSPTLSFKRKDTRYYNKLHGLDSNSGLLKIVQLTRCDPQIRPSQENRQFYNNSYIWNQSILQTAKYRHLCLFTLATTPLTHHNEITFRNFRVIFFTVLDEKKLIFWQCG